VARWQPDARERLVLAALDLFEEHGYERTTVIEIAQRAGLTKSTFFRHFPDKREVLFGGDAMAGLLGQGIAAAPATATPLQAVACALDAVGRQAFPPARREFTARRRAVIAATPELREREALKGLALAAAMTDALRRRGSPELTASVAAQLGVLALGLAYERWSEAPGHDVADQDDVGQDVVGQDDVGRDVGEAFGALARRALADVRAAIDDAGADGAGAAVGGVVAGGRKP
jgi:AcrR family transcriptional regulator